MAVVLILAALRLAAALAGLGLSVALGVRPAVAAVTFVVGATVLCFAALSTRRQGRWSGRDVRVERPLRAALAATYPSTIGLAVLTAASLALRPQLAALTSGLLAGLALLAAVVGAQIAWARR